MANLKHMNNDMAVSPIVATLVLIVVAVIGAVAVGTIMGSFSSDVSKQANSGDAKGASSTELIVAGSTTVLPASEEIAKVYMKDHPGVKITVQGGGSGAGFSSTKMGIVDIGAMSESAVANPTTYDATGMDLKEYQIGGSAIVVIENANSAIPNTLDMTNDLAAIYSTNASHQPTAAGFPNNVKVVYRADTSGTANEFGKMIGLGGQKVPVPKSGAINTTVSGQQGNAGVLELVSKATTPTIGFVDMGYAYDSANAEVTGIDAITVSNVGITYDAPTKANIKTALKNFNKKAVGTNDYPMIRGLYYITNGQPSSIAQSYITFAQSPGATAAINRAGMFSNADLS
jgi:phosphate transport system substrate-binding protein